MQTLTIGQLAKRCSLSRSTLIYYDTIGLLSPEYRSESNYRLYSENDLRKADRIMLFRSAGLSLDAISLILNREDGDLNRALEHRLSTINSEIQGLRNQQKVITTLLKNERSKKYSRVLDKQSWVSILRGAGLDDAGMKNWHIEFENTSPGAHQDFLESIGIDNDEIKQIRAWSRCK